MASRGPGLSRRQTQCATGWEKHKLKSSDKHFTASKLRSAWKVGEDTKAWGTWQVPLILWQQRQKRHLQQCWCPASGYKHAFLSGQSASSPLSQRRSHTWQQVCSPDDPRWTSSNLQDGSSEILQRAVTAPVPPAGTRRPLSPAAHTLQSSQAGIVKMCSTASDQGRHPKCSVTYEVVIIHGVMTLWAEETTLTCHNQQMTCYGAEPRRTNTKGLPAADYRVGGKAEWNSERGLLDKERPANYTQVKYTCSGAAVLKLTLSIVKCAHVTIGLQWFITDWNFAPHGRRTLLWSQKTPKQGHESPDWTHFNF